MPVYGGIHSINSKKLLWIRVTNFPLLCPWPASNYCYLRYHEKIFQLKDSPATKRVAWISGGGIIPYESFLMYEARTLMGQGDISFRS